MDSEGPRYRVNLEGLGFSGPLDLLLYLVRTNEFDITDIPVAEITDQYMEFVESMDVCDLDFSGEFLVMAATLLEIKSRMMLPSEALEEEEEDPRRELVRQLMEYRAFKERAGLLAEMKGEMDQRFPRGMPFAKDRGREADEGSLKEVELWDLMKAFSRVLSQTAVTMPSTLREDDVPVSEYMRRVMERLATSGAEIAFEDAFVGSRTRQQLIGIFLALLELARQLRIRIFQKSLFADIRIAVSDEVLPGSFELPEDERELQEAQAALEIEGRDDTPGAAEESEFSESEVSTMGAESLESADEGHPGFLNTTLPFEERVEDLLARMTLEEKTGQMLNGSPAIPRLGIPAYNWWNECLHGVARAGIATVFPQAIGLAATWDDGLIGRMMAVVSDEARAKHHEASRRGERVIYQGLTFWSPNINIFRDPRWGRGQETYGECPYLTGRIGVAFCKGLQGDDPKYLKLVATPKHYAVHSGPERDRHHFDARVSPKDLRETYLPAFKACVREAKAFSVMGAYNRTNGELCCASPTLLGKILRDEWGFTGYFVSDCGAISDFHARHKVTASPEESAALAVKNGCDLNCGEVYESLLAAVEKELVTEEEIDVAVRRLLMARMRLGMFDPDEMVPYAQIPAEIVDCEKHRALAAEVARETIVLLKNDGLLPLSKECKKIAVVGPTAENLDILLGNYYGTPSAYVTLLEGIRSKVGDGTEILYARGCEVSGSAADGAAEALAAAEGADVVIACMGYSPKLEGEEGEVADSDGGGDRPSLVLPGVQEELLKKLHATGKPVVLVLTNGSPVAINWAAENIRAVLDVWYPGEEGGTAVADVLFGDYNPAGRLPVTFVKSLDQLPPFTDYAMKGRTYRYMEDEPLYPFGFGLSYTRFEYGPVTLSSTQLAPTESLEVRVEVRNAGERPGGEVVQLYVSDLEASVAVPVRDLRGFRRIHLAAGETKTVSFTLAPRDLALIDSEGRAVLEPGAFTVSVGGCQPDARSKALGGTPAATATFTVTGEKTELVY